MTHVAERSEDYKACSAAGQVEYDAWVDHGLDLPGAHGVFTNLGELAIFLASATYDELGRLRHPGRRALSDVRWRRLGSEQPWYEAEHLRDDADRLAVERQAARWISDRIEANERPAGTDAEVGSLFAGPSDAEIKVNRLRSQLLTPAQLDALPPPQPLIGDILARDTIATIYGRPGSAKSFCAMDFALSVATGTWWHKRAVHRGPVLYCAAEGAAGLPQRKQAWEKQNNVYANDFPIRWLPRAVNLLNPDWTAALVTIVEELQPALVVIDTLARSMLGGDENAAKDMGQLVESADRLRQASGATALLVHHTPKAGGTLRGHSSLEGAVDTAIEAKNDAGRVTFTCEKQKDAAPFTEIVLRIAPVLSSAVLIAAHFGGEQVEAETAAQAALLLTICSECLPGGMTSAQIQESTGKSRATVNRAIKALLRDGALENIGTDARPRYRPS